MKHVIRTNRFPSYSCPGYVLDAKGAVLPDFFCAVFILALAVLPINGFALDRQQAEEIPHVDQRARESFLEYLYADHNKAFAIAPGGAWAWSAQQTGVEAAKQLALRNCRSHSHQRCMLYAVNDKLVFDRQAWPKLWRLDKQHTPAVNTRGIGRGTRFPDLVFRDARGKRYRVSDFKGKPVLIHFWASWCPPCMREMPSLAQLQQALKERHADKIKMVLLQVREPFTHSMQWAKQQGFTRLPMYDSGVKDSNDGQLYTAGGKTIADRKLARAFPSSYVLDGKGRVLFVHTGPITNWLEYLEFFRDIIEQDKT